MSNNAGDPPSWSVPDRLTLASLAPGGNGPRPAPVPPAGAGGFAAGSTIERLHRTLPPLPGDPTPPPPTTTTTDASGFPTGSTLDRLHRGLGSTK